MPRDVDEVAAVAQDALGVGGVVLKIELGYIADCDHLAIRCNGVGYTRGVVIGDPSELSLQDRCEDL